MRQFILRTLFLCALLAALAVHAAAQSAATNDGAAAPPTAVPGGKVSGNLFGLGEVQRQLREQGAEIERLRAILDQQTQLVYELRARVEHAELAAQQQPASVVARNAAYTPDGARGTAGGTAQDTPQPALDTNERLSRVEEQAKKTTEALGKQLGSIAFSGDIRLRYESFYGQQNNLANSDNPAVLGNPLTTRQRQRLRLRFGARGVVGKEFEWGLRLATGAYPDVISTNQTLTDFFSRKPFALDQAYLTYKPAALPGFQVQAGKFDVPWTRTELTFDNDINPEGLNESYTRTFKHTVVKNLAFIAWQLPFLERNSAFVLGANGRVNLDASGRAGRDLALYGAQLRTRLEPSKHLSLTLSAADLYFSGTQFISPAQVFGSNIQFPVTVTIPATATT
ncbi:MAG: putative porin, partial [Acidobacteria bacterium]|nr:putative porin [Acidobacteriota bacterium]